MKKFVKGASCSWICKTEALTYIGDCRPKHRCILLCVFQFNMQRTTGKVIGIFCFSFSNFLYLLLGWALVCWKIMQEKFASMCVKILLFLCQCLIYLSQLLLSSPVINNESQPEFEIVFLKNASLTFILLGPHFWCWQVERFGNQVEVLICTLQIQVRKKQRSVALWGRQEMLIE